MRFVIAGKDDDTVELQLKHSGDGSVCLNVRGPDTCGWILLMLVKPNGITHWYNASAQAVGFAPPVPNHTSRSG